MARPSDFCYFTTFQLYVAFHQFFCVRDFVQKAKAKVSQYVSYLTVRYVPRKLMTEFSFIWKATVKSTWCINFFLLFFYLNFSKSRKHNPTQQLVINQLSCWPRSSKQRKVAPCLFFQAPETGFCYGQHMDDINVNLCENSIT